MKTLIAVLLVFVWSYSALSFAVLNKIVRCKPLRCLGPAAKGVTSKFDKKFEIVNRGYPDPKNGLKVLTGRENYYSGIINDLVWHQNADRVTASFPVDGSLTRQAVDITFTAGSMLMTIMGEPPEEVIFSQTIIPLGSFWTFEWDDSGRKHIQLDIEKR